MKTQRYRKYVAVSLLLLGLLLSFACGQATSPSHASAGGGNVNVSKVNDTRGGIYLVVDSDHNLVCILAFNQSLDGGVGVDCSK